MQAREKTRALLTLAAAGALGGSGVAFAAPKVCGNQAALGSFAADQCPELRDDGVAPDEAPGDGIYTAAVQLTATPLLEYKILPAGTYDGKELAQVGGACGAQGADKNGFKNIQIPSPDTSRKATFYYDTRVLTGPGYAAPPDNRSAGDDLMVRSSLPGGCPQWLAVGEFQNVPFDKVVGAVPLTLQRPGVLAGRLTAMKALAAGWKWKIVEGGGASPARRYGPSGWTYEPCDTDSASVPTAVRAGDVLYFTFYTAGGRLQASVVTSEPDAGVGPGMPLCPPVPDMRGPEDLAQGTADLRPPELPDGGAGTDAAPADPTDGGAGDGGERKLPGIHCDCRIGAASTSAAASAASAATGQGLLAALALGALGWLRARRPKPRAGLDA